MGQHAGSPTTTRWLEWRESCVEAPRSTGSALREAPCYKFCALSSALPVLPAELPSLLQPRKGDQCKSTQCASVRTSSDENRRQRTSKPHAHVLAAVYYARFLVCTSMRSARTSTRSRGSALFFCEEVVCKGPFANARPMQIAMRSETRAVGDEDSAIQMVRRPVMQPNNSRMEFVAEIVRERETQTCGTSNFWPTLFQSVVFLPGHFLSSSRSWCFFKLEAFRSGRITKSIHVNQKHIEESI